MTIEYYSEEDDYGISDNMLVLDDTGKQLAQEAVYPLCECPEDAVIGRGLISCSRIIDLMELAYQAGKNGQEFVVKTTPVKD